jgi:hypothetical protein
MLRATIERLAAMPDAQVRYLDNIFTEMTGGESAVAYGNDELVLEFDDIFPAAEHMLEYREITQAEIDAIQPLADMLDLFCREADDFFWQRDALYSDDRWKKLRYCAGKALHHLPDEKRESDYTRGLMGETD